MNIYIVVETKYSGEHEEKRIRGSSFDESWAMRLADDLRYAKRDFNEPVSSYYTEEVPIEELVNILI